MSAFAPVTNSTRALTAIVGIDAGSAELEILERMRSRLYWIAAGCAALTLVAALIFARSITRPIRHIANIAERLGSGDYSARADVHTRDEVEVLATAVNHMAEQVRERDAALKEMAASVAHEVRNPLNSIKLLLALLAEDIAANRRRLVIILWFDFEDLAVRVDLFLLRLHSRRIQADCGQLHEHDAEPDSREPDHVPSPGKGHLGMC